MLRRLLASTSALALATFQVAPACAGHNEPVAVVQLPAFAGGDIACPARSVVCTIGAGAVTAAKMGTGAAVGNLGYTPTNKAGDTMTGPLGLVAPAIGANDGNADSTGNSQRRLSHVSNASLVAAWANTGFPVEVDGFSTPGDGGRHRMVYDSANACGAGGHPAADGVTCVNSTVSGQTGSWNIDWASVGQVASPCMFESTGSTIGSNVGLQAAVNTGMTVDLSCKNQWNLSAPVTFNTAYQIVKGLGRDRTYAIGLAPSFF